MNPYFGPDNYYQTKPLPSFVLKTGPANEPVWLDDVKVHSRIGIDEDDLLIQAKIIGARQLVEKQYDLALITQTWTMYLDWLPPFCIEILKRPIQSITFVKYLDGDGVLQTVDPALYVADVNSRPPRIALKTGASWPYVQAQPSGVQVEFVAGYGATPQTVPQHVRHYLLFKIADLYEHRESASDVELFKHDFVDELMTPERLFSSW